MLYARLSPAMPPNLMYIVTAFTIQCAKSIYRLRETEHSHTKKGKK